MAAAHGGSRARWQPRTVAAALGGSSLHFGQIAPQRCAYAARQKGGDNASFIEELVVRRELADNFCFYNASSAPLAALRPLAVLACFTSAPGPGSFNATSAPGTGRCTCVLRSETRVP